MFMSLCLSSPCPWLLAQGPDLTYFPQAWLQVQKNHLGNVAKIQILGPFIPELWICSSCLCGPRFHFDQAPRTSLGADQSLGTLKTLCNRDGTKSQIVV